LRFLAGALLVVSGCFGSYPSHAQIAYHLAVIEGDSLEVASDECIVQNEAPISYRYPSGSHVSVRVPKDPVLMVPLDESVQIRLVDFSDSRSSEMRAVVADVVPSTTVLNQAADVRRALLRCDLLITLNGKAVGVERRGTDWSQRLPGGTFSTMEVAERAFAESGASVRHEAPSAAELDAEDEYWEWRKQKDLWDFHCDSTKRETLRFEDRELYAALMQTPAPDCQTPPVRWERRPVD
jgi:hypothetical protein